MTASRNRRLLIIGVLAALFALGGGCLAYLATASPGGSAAGSNAAGAGQPSTLASSDGSSSDSAGAPDAGSSGGGDDDTAPPKPRRNVPTTGIDLDGNGDIECFTAVIVTDRVQLPLRVRSTQVTSTNGAIVADPGGCSDCVGARLGPDNSQSCQVGVRLSGNKPYPPEVSVTVTLAMDATCTDPSRKPCDDPRVVALAPATANPIAVNVIGTLVRTVDVPDEESPDSPPAESPATPDPGEESSTPDTESVPAPGASEQSS